MLSQVARSNLFTKAVAAKFDSRQEVPERYAIPNVETRLLLARLIYEEAMETIQALGCYRVHDAAAGEHSIDLENIERDKLNIDDIIDGCCDTIYVATGALCAVGAPDVRHLQEVCVANDSKFPQGNAIIDPKTGKYLKPKDWKAPDHAKIRESYARGQPCNLRFWGLKFVQNAKSLSEEKQ